MSLNDEKIYPAIIPLDLTLDRVVRFNLARCILSLPRIQVSITLYIYGQDRISKVVALRWSIVN